MMDNSVVRAHIYSAQAYQITAILYTGYVKIARMTILRQTSRT